MDDSLNKTVLHRHTSGKLLQSSARYTAAGTCFLVGGCFHKQQRFNATCNRTCGALLFLSAVGIAMPTAASFLITDSHARPDWVLATSRAASLVLLTW